MPCDLSISYSQRDNERGQATAVKAQIESSFRAFAGCGSRVFFDTHEIAGMDDWRQKIQRSLCDSSPMRRPTRLSPLGLTRFSVARPSICARGDAGEKALKQAHGKNPPDELNKSVRDWTAASCSQSAITNPTQPLTETRPG